MTSTNSNHSLKKYEYQVGGSLKIESPTYVTRRADAELYSSLQNGDFCYVLNCRQMGKSSLRVQAMAKLQAEGVTCVVIQMTDIIEESMSAEEWYAGVINSIVTDMALPFNDFDWWEQHNHLSLVNRFSKFIDEILLQLVQAPIVIFIDEIDRILSLPFTVNGFFAVIRECYNNRADEEKYRRLTFALLGVATPSDLIADKRSTPFNVGKAIELTGFTLQEATPLVSGLLQVSSQPKAVLQKILYWTSGQPFLTQKICNLLVQRSRTGRQFSSDDIEEFIHNNIINNWEANDEPEHFRTIRDRLLRDELKAGRRISLYQEILTQGSLIADAANMDHMELRLSGLVVEHQGKLEIYNHIYGEIFNQAWAEQALTNLRPYAASINAWQASNQQDKSRLLHGEALEEARQWAADKVLPAEDYSYLTASQQLATEAAEEARQTLAQANETLAEANEQANKRISQANRRLKIGTTILISTIVAAILIGGHAQQQATQAKNNIETAEKESKKAAQETKSAKNQLDKAQKATDKARKDKQKAEEDLKNTRQKSETIIAEAENSLFLAQQEQSEAQEQTLSAQQRASEAQEAAKKARAAEINAQKEAALASNQMKRAIEIRQLERKATELISRPTIHFRGLDTLLDALDGSYKLQKLLSSEQDSSQDISNYPAPDFFLGLRTSLNSILEVDKIKELSLNVSDIIAQNTNEKDTWENHNCQNRWPTVNNPDQQEQISNIFSDFLTIVFSENCEQVAVPSFYNPSNSYLTDSSYFLNDIYPFPFEIQIEGLVIDFDKKKQQWKTHTIENSTSHFYTTSKNLLSYIKADSVNISPNQQQIAISDFAGSYTHLYDLSGQKIQTFRGRFRAFSDNGNQLITESEVYPPTASIDASISIDSWDVSNEFLDEGTKLYHQTYLHDISNNKSTSFEGYFIDFNPDTQQIITISNSADDNSKQAILIYDLLGNLVGGIDKNSADFSQELVGLSQESQRLVTYSWPSRAELLDPTDGNIYGPVYPEEFIYPEEFSSMDLYDMQGQWINTVEGESVQFSAKGNHFVTYDPSVIDSPYLNEPVVYDIHLEHHLYDSMGNKITTFNEDFLGFTTDSQYFLTSSYEPDTSNISNENSVASSHLYDLLGKKLATFKGEVIDVSSVGQRVITHEFNSYPDEDVIRLYDFSGNELEIFEGKEFIRFSDDHKLFILYSSQNQTSDFYNFSGKSIKFSVEGHFRQFHRDRDLLITTVSDENVSRIYNRSGELLAEFSGSTNEQDLFNYIPFGIPDPDFGLSPFGLPGPDFGFSPFGLPGPDFRFSPFGLHNSNQENEPLGFTPDGNHLLTFSNDINGSPIFHLWRLDEGINDLLEQGCEWVKDYLESNPEEDRANFCRARY